jgi:hypothetical protein
MPVSICSNARPRPAQCSTCSSEQSTGVGASGRERVELAGARTLEHVDVDAGRDSAAASPASAAVATEESCAAFAEQTPRNRSDAEPIRVRLHDGRAFGRRRRRAQTRVVACEGVEIDLKRRAGAWT